MVERWDGWDGGGEVGSTPATSCSLRVGCCQKHKMMVSNVPRSVLLMGYSELVSESVEHEQMLKPVQGDVSFSTDGISGVFWNAAKIKNTKFNKAINWIGYFLFLGTAILLISEVYFRYQVVDLYAQELKDLNPESIFSRS